MSSVTAAILFRPPSSPLQWRHNEHDDVSNHQLHDCLLNRLFRRRSKKTPKLRVTGLCAGNSPLTGEFPPQRASTAENVSIWWRHHLMPMFTVTTQGRPLKCRLFHSPHLRRLRLCQAWTVETVYLKWGTGPKNGHFGANIRMGSWSGNSP